MFKPIKNYIVGLIAALLALFAYGCVESTENENQSEVAVEDVTVSEKMVFENDYVMAMDVTLNPNQQIPWHEGGARVIYSDSDYTVRFMQTPDDTVSTTNEFTEGDVHWHEQNPHSVVNTGSSTAEFMVFMRKPSTFPEDTDLTTQSDVEEVESESANEVMENEAVKVIKVSLAPGEQTPLHVGTKRAIYSLNNYDVRFNKPDETAENNQFEEGDVHWHEGGEHEIENTGDSTAEFLMVEFKQ